MLNLIQLNIPQNVHINTHLLLSGDNDNLSVEENTLIFAEAQKTLEKRNAFHLDKHILTVCSLF